MLSNNLRFLNEKSPASSTPDRLSGRCREGCAEYEDANQGVKREGGLYAAAHKKDLERGRRRVRCGRSCNRERRNRNCDRLSSNCGRHCDLVLRHATTGARAPGGSMARC